MLGGARSTCCARFIVSTTDLLSAPDISSFSSRVGQRRRHVARLRHAAHGAAAARTSGRTTALRAGIGAFSAINARLPAGVRLGDSLGAARRVRPSLCALSHRLSAPSTHTTLDSGMPPSHMAKTPQLLMVDDTPRNMGPRSKQCVHEYTMFIMRSVAGARPAVWKQGRWGV